MSPLDIVEGVGFPPDELVGFDTAKSVALSSRWYRPTAGYSFTSSGNPSNAIPQSSIIDPPLPGAPPMRGEDNGAAPEGESGPEALSEPAAASFQSPNLSVPTFVSSVTTIVAPDRKVEP